MSTPRIRTFDPNGPRQLVERRLIPAWSAAREAQPAMERDAALDADRKQAKDDALKIKYGMDNR